VPLIPAPLHQVVEGDAQHYGCLRSKILPLGGGGAVGRVQDGPPQQE
jgi:hypothetical protein